MIYLLLRRLAYEALSVNPVFCVKFPKGRTLVQYSNEEISLYSVSKGQCHYIGQLHQCRRLMVAQTNMLQCAVRGA